MKFMNAVSPSRSRSGPQGASSETSGSAKRSKDGGEGDGAATTSSGRGPKDSSGDGVFGGAADSIGVSDCGAASTPWAEGSACISAITGSGGSAGGSETVVLGAAEASGGERSFIAACPGTEARQPE